MRMYSRYRLPFLIILSAIVLTLGFFFTNHYFLTQKKIPSALFELISRDSSGIDFENKITTSDSLNIFTFEYLYNGGGVGIGDFNNDGLPDIYFSGNMVPGKLYLNQGNFRFKDITQSAGINIEKGWPFGVSVIDVNQGKDKNGDPYFKEMAAEYGLKDHGQSIQAAFFDYDHDGDLDMYLVKG